VTVRNIGAEEELFRQQIEVAVSASE